MLIKLFRTLTITVLISLLCNPVWAQSAISKTPASGFDTARLGRIDTTIETEIEAGKIPGAVALVARNGEIVYLRSFGFADLESQKPMQTDSIFRIASMTKAITTVAVMLLYEQGRFQLSDPVGTYIPSFSEMNVISSTDDGGKPILVSASKPIRIIDLLTHTSGISYPFISNGLQNMYVNAGLIDGPTAKDITLESQMELLATQPLLFEPGSQWAYGLSSDLLGYLVEVISGQPLDQFFAENIFEPLGMIDSYFYLPQGKADRLVTLYADVAPQGLVVAKGDEPGFILDNPNFPVEGARRYFSAGAGLSSTAGDYARFCQMLLNGGVLDGKRIISRKSVELMRAPRADIDNDGSDDFSLGFYVITDLGESGELGSAGTYSWGGVFNTAYWIDPAENLIGVIMTQVRPANSNINERFRTLVYQALE